jgi:3-carboxymuconate cyclase
MNISTFLIGYGDQLNTGRGIYRVSVIEGHIQANLVFSCSEKPGALIQIDNQIFVSYQGEHRAGIYAFLISDENTLTLNKQFELPYFITAFAQSNLPNMVLGSSFYDGVDVLLHLTNEIEVIDVKHHQHRYRNEDKRQATAHPHHIGVIPKTSLAFSVDMGADFVSLYGLAETGLTVKNTLLIDSPIGDGPRIMRIRSDGQFAYLLNEISNTVCVFSITTDVETQSFCFTEIQRLSTLFPDTQVDNSPAACVMTDDETYLVISNRGENSLVLFRINAESGLLYEQDRVSTAANPRDVFISGEQVLVAAQTANTLQLWHIDRIHHRLLVLDSTYAINPVAFMTH